MSRIVAISALLCLLGLSAAAQSPDWPVPVGRPDSPERDGVFVGSFGHGPYFPSWRSVWPVGRAPLITTKLSTTMDAEGLIAGDRDDPFAHSADQSFEFPRGSGIQYLFGSYMILGGIVNGDTLASNQVVFNGMRGNEYFSPDNPFEPNSLTPIDIGIGTAFRTVRVDTFTYPKYGALGIAWDEVRRTYHIPLHVEVIQKSYVCDLPRFQNMVLLDYTITNIGDAEISDGWIGLLLDPWVGKWSAADYYGGSYTDDFMGGLRDVASMYIIDDDGDPSNGYFHQGEAAVDGLGLRPTKMYPPPTDTNFNWWHSTYWTTEPVDFGPRRRPTQEDPWYDLPNGYIGFPDGDVCWHYVLSHPEWDYDQVRTASISPDDSVWMYPEDRALARDLANGADCDALLSVGPFDLLPDSSMRVVFAMFGADFIHTDPTNGQYLAAGDYDLYFSNLDFSVFRQRADEALAATDELLGPESPPTGLHPTYLSNDTVRLAWDPRVFDDIDGYEVYLTPVDNSLYIDKRVVPPGVEPEQVHLAKFVEPGRHEVELTGLDPARFYFASVAHRSRHGTGRRSPSVVVGYGNQALEPDTVRMKRYHAFYQPDDTGIVLSWFPSEQPDVAWYRIYKVSDSTQAAGRYPWFFSMDSSLSPVPPRQTGRTDDRPWCYYRMRPYDSVPAPQTGYVDTKISTEGWYWVTAVTRYGDESPFSELVTASPTTAPTRDLLVILSSIVNLHDWVIRDSLFAYYDRLLDGYDYDIYSWSDTNHSIFGDNIDYQVDWLDLARYRMVLVEEMTSPSVLTQPTEESYHTLEKIIASGKDLIYFGTPPGSLYVNLNLNEPRIQYDRRSFEARYFHLDSARLATWQGQYHTYGVVDSLGGFDRAVPMKAALPSLAVDPAAGGRMTSFIHRLFSIDGYLPLTPGFYPDSEAEVLYTYGSKFPASSEFEGVPCGVLTRHPGANVWTFAFHLWAIVPDDARQLIDYIMKRQAPDSELSPYFLPTTIHLAQNYPNPFNPSTTIEFELEKRQYITLEIFDLLGRRTVTLVDRELPAGPHQIVWNGRDKNGHPVASGIYIYRLRGEGTSLVRKMALVK